MFDNIRFFLNFRKQNRIVSEVLGLKRDKKIELYLLFNLWKSNRLVNILKRNCRCYLEYYLERESDPNFRDLDYIINRIAAQYNIIEDKEILEEEFDRFENPFSRDYVKKRVEELIGTSDTGTINLVEEAVL